MLSIPDRSEPNLDPPADGHGHGAADHEVGPISLSSFHREVEALQGRIDGLPTRRALDPQEVYEALDSTMEELRVAVEQLRLTNDALRDSRAEVEIERRQYRDLFEMAPDAYIATDLQGVIREANRAASVLLHIDHAFLVGKPLAVFVPEEGRPAFRSELARLPELIGTQEYDLRLRPRGLAPFDAALRVGVVRDPFGRPTAFRWIARDISARRRAEEKIRQLNAQLERQFVERSEQLESVLQTNERWLIKAHAADSGAGVQAEGRLFQDLVDEVDAILWRADAASGRYTFVSKRAEQLLGHPASRWIEDSGFWLAQIHPEDRDWASAYRRKMLRERLDHEAEYRVLASDGRPIWFRESVRILRGDEGRSDVLCGLMVNISKRKKVERQLYTAKGELAMQLRDMNYLRELGGRLASARGRQATLDEVLSAAASLLGAEMAVVMLRQPEGDSLVAAATLGLDPEFVRLIGLRPHDTGEVGRRLAGRGSVCIEDIETQADDFGIRQAARTGRFRALFAVPLFTRDGEHLGAVAAFFRSPYRPPERQARLAEMYAEHAADAIETSRLRGEFEESESRVGRHLGRVADEMRGPLASILAAAADPEPDRSRAAIEEQARRLAGLVEDLLEMTHAEGPTPGA